MFYTTEDAIKHGLKGGYWDKERWASLRDIFIAHCKMALDRNQLDLASMFATQAQFYREALQAKDIAEQFKSDEKLMEIINQC